MSASLQLVANNPHPAAHRRTDAATLHRLADHLTAQVKAGNSWLAHVMAFNERLNPFGVAAVATWMSRAGLSEDQILAVMVGQTNPAAQPLGSNCRPQPRRIGV